MSDNVARDQCTGDELLVPGALRGFRSWDLEYLSNPLIDGRAREEQNFIGLYAMGVSVQWQQPMVAKCLPHAGCPCPTCRGRRERRTITHDPAEGNLPIAECECGIYAWYHPNWIEADRWWPKAGAVGVIEASGKVVMGPRGFRAAQARTIAVAPACNADALADGMGVIGFMERFDRIRDRLAQHDIKVFDDVDDLHNSYPPEDLSALVDVELPVEGTYDRHR